MSRKPTHHEPSPEEEGQQILADAEAAGSKYASEQLEGDYFKDWAYSQLVDADEMRKRDPKSVIPLTTLGWDVRRQEDTATILELAGATGVFQMGNRAWVKDHYGITERDVVDTFYDGVDSIMKAPTTVDWLADELEQMHEQWAERRHPRATEARRRIPSIPGAAHGLEWHRYRGGFIGTVDGTKRFILDPDAHSQWLLWTVNPSTEIQDRMVGRYPPAADAKDAARRSLQSRKTVARRPRVRR